MSPLAQRVYEGLPRLLGKYQGQNQQLGMISGILNGWLQTLLPKVPEAALLGQLLELRTELDTWIGDAADPDDVIPYHMEYDTSYDVPTRIEQRKQDALDDIDWEEKPIGEVASGLEIDMTDERRTSETGGDGETNGGTPDVEPTSTS